MSKVATQLVSDEVDFPTYVRPGWRKVLPDLQLISRLLAGTREMHAHAAEYIRKWKDEDQEVWKIRAKGEQVFVGLERTLSAAIGMLFSQPPAIEWNKAEQAIEPHWDNIDGGGTKGIVFLKQFTEAAVRDGIGLILVDFTAPQRDPETGEIIELSALEAEELNVRPTWARYDRQLIRNWRTGKINNQQELTLLTLYEPTKINVGLFGTAVEHRWRVLRLGEHPMAPGEGVVASWELWRLKPEAEGGERDDFEIIGLGIFRNSSGEAAETLPVAIAYTGRKDGVLKAAPPLIGVAWANLGLWQIATNLRFYLELVCFPQPVIVGDLALEPGYDEEGNQITIPGDFKMGPMVGVHLSSGTKETGPSKYEFVIPPSEGFEPNERAIVKKREDMAALGMSFLNRDKRTAETAEAKRLDATAENATLATAAQGLDDAGNHALKIHAWYMGIEEEDAPELSLNRDFDSITMSPEQQKAWIAGVKEIGLPVWVLLEAWKKGGVLPDGIDLDELIGEIEAEQAAQEEQDRLDRERQAEEARARLEGGNPPPEPPPGGEE